MNISVNPSGINHLFNQKSKSILIHQLYPPYLIYSIKVRFISIVAYKFLVHNMPRNPFAFDITSVGFGPNRSKSKRRHLTHAEKIFCWEHKSHVCNICGKRVSKFSDAEFDHTRAFKKGGATNLSNVKIVHRQCNRLKGKKSLSETKRRLGIKSKGKKRKSKKKASKKPFNPLAPSFRMPRLRF